MFNRNTECPNTQDYRVSNELNYNGANMTRIQGELNKKKCCQHEKDTGYLTGKVYWVYNRTRILGVQQDKNTGCPKGKGCRGSNRTRFQKYKHDKNIGCLTG